MKDGGPAFPHDFGRGDRHGGMYDGMTMRDWFAGQALAGELAAQDERRDGKGTGIWHFDCLGTLAERCYAIADAMIAERERSND